MTQGILLDRRVDLEKLTQDDFKISGELRVTDEPYQGYRLKPEFKLTETDTYVPLDQLFPESKFHECYQLILQTPDHTEFLGSGYLHRPEARPVSFCTRDTLREQILEKRVYDNASPIYFRLLDDETNKSIVQGPVDLIFVKTSPWHNERDQSRERVLYSTQE